MPTDPKSCSALATAVEAAEASSKPARPPAPLPVLASFALFAATEWTHGKRPTPGRQARPKGRSAAVHGCCGGRTAAREKSRDVVRPPLLRSPSQADRVRMSLWTAPSHRGYTHTRTGRVGTGLCCTSSLPFAAADRKAPGGLGRRVSCAAMPHETCLVCVERDLTHACTGRVFGQARAARGRRGKQGQEQYTQEALFGGERGVRVCRTARHGTSLAGWSNSPGADVGGVSPVPVQTWEG
jgi:hypothetical protein